MPFNAPFQQNMNFLNSGGGGMGFSAPQNDRANWGGGNSGFDFSQFPQFGQGYGSALSGGTNGYFGQGFGNSNFGQVFGNENFGQGFGGQMSGGNYGQGYGGGMSGGNYGQVFGNENFGQGFNTRGNFSQFTNPQQNIASPYGQMSGGNYGQGGQGVGELAQQNNAPPGFGGYAFGTSFANGNAPEGFYAAQSQHNLQQRASALGITPEAVMQQMGSRGQPLNQQNASTNSQPLPPNNLTQQRAMTQKENALPEKNFAPNIGRRTYRNGVDA